MRQQPSSNLSATSKGGSSGQQRGQPHATMMTEYQASYVHPKCYTTMAVVAGHKDRYHTLKGTGVDHTTLRKIYVSHKLHPNVPPKDRKPKMQPTKVPGKCSCSPQTPPCSVPKQMPSVLDGYTSVYKDSFQAWKINKRKPLKLPDGLKVNQGLVVTNGTYQNNSAHAAAKNVQEPLPFESVTSYRCDYVIHPLQPMIRREKHVDYTKGLPLQLSASSKPKPAQDVNQELLDEDSELDQQFKTLSLENCCHCRCNAREPSQLADYNNFLSTTHADFTAHNCERTQPYLPSTHNLGKSRKPFQGISTMKDDYRAWDTPRRFPSLRKDHDYPKRSIISHCIPKSAVSLQEGAVCPCICHVTRTTPAENGECSILGSIIPGTEESRMGWTSPLDIGVTWANDGICAEAPQDPQLCSCLASDRS
ncbi:stabilizer of axonemal microtubules 2 [Sebastes umbrosus]|uniref:stabilizer of axonemal microtubules 2 n=1 Tax=Sebastes umbrosus TaxID=72105 RepID=UPI0018A0DA13|nr:stabilizer of axonemal microtubules 2 [Sebastes umbrosus]